MRRLILPSTLTMICLVACVRWGVPDDESIADDTTTDDTTSETDSSSDSSSDTGPEPWPEQWPFSAESRLVVWGKSGIPTVNLTMVGNAYYNLAGVAPGEASLTILWIGDCDPRTDPQGCLAGDVQPYFDMVDALGTVEFALLSSVDPSAYDVIVADFCEPVDQDQIAALLAAGAGVMALGSRFCTVADGRTGAEAASELLGHFGLRFLERELYNHQFTVPADKQIDLLAGITSLDAWGLTLQETIPPVVVAVETLDGAVLGYRSEP